MAEERAGPVYLSFEKMTWPNPRDPSEVEWALRYGGELTRSQRLVAASFIAAYKQLVGDMPKVRNEKIDGLHRALRQVSDG